MLLEKGVLSGQVKGNRAGKLCKKRKKWFSLFASGIFPAILTSQGYTTCTRKTLTACTPYTACTSPSPPLPCF